MVSRSAIESPIVRGKNDIYCPTWENINTIKKSKTNYLSYKQTCTLPLLVYIILNMIGLKKAKQSCPKHYTAETLLTHWFLRNCFFSHHIKSNCCTFRYCPWRLYTLCPPSPSLLLLCLNCLMVWPIWPFYLLVSTAARDIWQIFMHVPSIHPLARMTRGARHSLGGYKLWRVMRWGLINYLPEPPSITINWPLLLSPAARPAQP